MPIRLQRRIRIAPGIRLNLSKSGIGISAGVRGLRLGLDSHGRPYGSAGLPGTGLSVREYGHRPVDSGAHPNALALGAAVAVVICFVLYLIGMAAKQTKEGPRPSQDAAPFFPARSGGAQKVGDYQPDSPHGARRLSDRWGLSFLKRHLRKLTASTSRRPSDLSPIS